MLHVLLFWLTAINDMDRVVLPVGAPRFTVAFSLSPVRMGYLFSSFIWSYLATLPRWGMALDRFGSRASTSPGVPGPAGDQ